MSSLQIKGSLLNNIPLCLVSRKELNSLLNSILPTFSVHPLYADDTFLKK